MFKIQAFSHPSAVGRDSGLHRNDAVKSEMMKKFHIDESSMGTVQTLNYQLITSEFLIPGKL
jgi:hypothetical protein